MLKGTPPSLFILMKSFGVTPHGTPLQTVFLHFTLNGMQSDMPESPLTYFQEKKLMQLHCGSTKGACDTKHSWEKVHSPFQEPFSTEKIHKRKRDIRNILFCCEKLFSICINWCCQFRQPDGVFMYPLPSNNNMGFCAVQNISCSFKFVFSLSSNNNRFYPFCSSPLRVTSSVIFPHISYIYRARSCSE